MQASKRRPSPALIISIIALIAALTSSAYAAGLGKNSVGPRQLKSKSVTTGKIANNAVTGAKVAKETLTGADIKIGGLPSVPNAAEANHAKNADTLGDNHAANCPGGTTLIRGLCFDLALNPPVAGIKAAANACAGKGGFLPTTMMLYSVRNVINLGTGVPPDHAIADSYFSNTTGVNYEALTVDGSGKIAEFDNIDNGATKYICVYQLVR
jgi:hypothetical protein